MADGQGGAAVVRWMESQGIGDFFHVPGESFLAVLDGLRDSDRISVTTHRHESGASFAAEAYGKLTGRPAVCMATRAPGATNLSIGVHTAHYDRTPMIALVGLVATAQMGAGGFQDFDAVSLFGSLAKRVSIVRNSSAIRPTLDAAYEIATTGTPGPVVVGLPVDVLEALVPDDEGAATLSPVPVLGRPDIGELVASLSDAHGVALLIGTEVERRSTASHLSQLATMLGIPVFCTWRRFSAFDNAHECFVGSIGLGASEKTLDFLDRANTLVHFGTGLDDVTCSIGRIDRPGRQVIVVSPELSEATRRLLPHSRLSACLGSPEVIAKDLVEWWRARPTQVEQLHRRQLSPRPAWAPVPVTERTGDGEAAGVDMARVIDRMHQMVSADAIVTSDAGNFSQWLLNGFRFDRRRTLVAPMSGAMGYGLPAAIGAQRAFPSRPVWVLAGDGGFAMTMGELDTAVRNRLSVAVVVCDNSSFGTIREHQLKKYPGREIGTQLSAVDFAGVARGLGATAWRANTDEEFEAALDEVQSAGGVRVLHARIAEHPMSCGA